MAGLGVGCSFVVHIPKLSLLPCGSSIAFPGNNACLLKNPFWMASNRQNRRGDSVRRYCYCGADYIGNGTCSEGRSCPRQELGHGQWCDALRQFENMPRRVLSERYPRLRLDDVRRRCARHERQQHHAAMFMVPSPQDGNNRAAASRLRNRHHFLSTHRQLTSMHPLSRMMCI